MWPRPFFVLCWNFGKSLSYDGNHIYILYVESCFSPLEFKREMLSIQNVAKLNARRTKPILLNREYHLSLARLPSLATRGLPFSRHLARSSHLTLRWLFCAF